MFDTLSDKLQATLGDLRGRGRLSEEDVARATREIASSSSRPRPRRSPSAAWSLSESVSNIGGEVY